MLQDGYLDEKEVAQWILPDDYDSAIAESKHLIHEADMNKVSVVMFKHRTPYLIQLVCGLWALCGTQ